MARKKSIKSKLDTTNKGKLKDYPAHLGQTRVSFIIYVRIILICYNFYMI